MRRRCLNRCSSTGHLLYLCALRLLLSLQYAVDWEGYLALEALYEVLARRATPERKILMLQQLTLSITNALANQRQPDAARVKELIMSFQGIKLEGLLDQIRFSSKSEGKRDPYLAILVQLVESSFSREIRGESFSVGQIVGRVLKHWKASGASDLNVFKITSDYARAKASGSISLLVRSENLWTIPQDLVKSLVGHGQRSDSQVYRHHVYQLCFAEMVQLRLGRRYAISLEELFYDFRRH